MDIREVKDQRGLIIYSVSEDLLPEAARQLLQEAKKRDAIPGVMVFSCDDSELSKDPWEVCLYCS